jgi:hypothetical protein
MSVEYHVFLLDWDELQRQWRDDPQALDEPEFHEEGWPARFAHEDWNPDGWIDSGHAASEASAAYDDLRKGLDARTRDPFDRILGAFFWDGGVVTPDLPGLEPSEGISHVLSPGTVAAMADVARALDLEELRAPFAQLCHPFSEGWIADFEAFRDYVKQWLDMLGAARDTGKALVLWVA